MTDAQRKYFYFPLWLGLARALDWRMEGGRLTADLDEQLKAAERWPEHAAKLATVIILRARLTADGEKRAVTAEDLRHACNVQASGGSTDSATSMTQRHLNHFGRLCAVLRDPWDLTATMAWLNPAEDDRLKTVEWIRKLAPEARLMAISRNAWQTEDWASQDQARLDSLAAELRKAAWSGRGRSRRHSSAEAAPVQI